jgi:hypothetical protein
MLFDFLYRIPSQLSCAFHTAAVSHFPYIKGQGPRPIKVVILPLNGNLPRNLFSPRPNLKDVYVQQRSRGARPDRPLVTRATFRLELINKLRLLRLQGFWAERRGCMVLLRTGSDPQCLKGYQGRRNDR